MIEVAKTAVRLQRKQRRKQRSHIVLCGICHLQDPIDDVYLELEKEKTEWVLCELKTCQTW